MTSKLVALTVDLYSFHSYVLKQRKLNDFELSYDHHSMICWLLFSHSLSEDTDQYQTRQTIQWSKLVTPQVFAEHCLWIWKQIAESGNVQSKLIFNTHLDLLFIHGSNLVRHFSFHGICAPTAIVSFKPTIIACDNGGADETDGRYYSENN